VLHGIPKTKCSRPRPMITQYAFGAYKPTYPNFLPPTSHFPFGLQIKTRRLQDSNLRPQRGTAFEAVALTTPPKRHY
jgi:hypothetical protein